MYSEDTKKVIADLNEFLKFKHPSSVLQFITGMMIDWTHIDKKQPSSKFDIDLAWNKYFDLLRTAIDKRLSFISPPTGRDQSLSSIPPYVYEEKKRIEIATLLGNMSSEDAINFIVEVTTNWCFSIPVNFLPLLPDAPHDESDEAVANAIYLWLVRYSDLWN